MKVWPDVTISRFVPGLDQEWNGSHANISLAVRAV